MKKLLKRIFICVWKGHIDWTWPYFNVIYIGPHEGYKQNTKECKRCGREAYVNVGRAK